MENMGRVLLYLFGIAWAFMETFLIAEAGSWFPLLLMFALFVVAFVILGCWPAEDATIIRAGNLFLIVIAAACLVFTLGGLQASLFGVLKLIAAGILCAAAVFNLLHGEEPAHG